MSRRRSRRRGSLGRSVKQILEALVAHPVRAGIVGFSAVGLSWLVLTKSLPYALAPTAPDLALWFNPNHPVALLTKADGSRKRLLTLITKQTAETETRDAGESRQSGSGAVARYAAPALAADNHSPAAERKALRSEIRELATRVIANDPLNAHAFRLLAEVTDDPKRVRVLMQAAVKRSRHESTALFWLLNDSFHRKDFTAALEHADILLRTRPALTPYVMSYLGQIAEDPAALGLLVKRLAAAPSWRGAFFGALPRSIRRGKTPLEIMIALKDSDKPISGAELKPYLTFLLKKKRVNLAYNAWLQLLPKEQLSTLGLVYNPSFESELSGLPFDWQIRRPLNATVEFRSDGIKKKTRALHINFGAGRVTFPTVSQVLMLSPDRYKLTVQFRGDVTAKRGLRWRLSCLFGKRQTIAETDMLLGAQPEWRTVALDVDVPDKHECRAQTLSLLHDARSASEQIITGEAWFDDIKLTRIDN